VWVHPAELHDEFWTATFMAPRVGPIVKTFRRLEDVKTDYEPQLLVEVRHFWLQPDNSWATKTIEMPNN